jgi:hypothetical protein
MQNLEAQIIFTVFCSKQESVKYSHIGYNYAMNNILAATGRDQLKVLDERVEARNRLVFMGDEVSVLLGFMFAVLVVLLWKSFLDFVCLASFLFPFYADELTTMAVRVRDGENLLKPHRRHLYQLLANEYSIAHWKISVGYGVLQLVVGLTVLMAKPHGLLVVLSLLFAYFAAFTFVSFSIRRKLADTGEQA